MTVRRDSGPLHFVDARREIGKRDAHVLFVAGIDGGARGVDLRAARIGDDELAEGRLERLPEVDRDFVRPTDGRAGPGCCSLGNACANASCVEPKNASASAPRLNDDESMMVPCVLEAVDASGDICCMRMKDFSRAVRWTKPVHGKLIQAKAGGARGCAALTNSRRGASVSGAEGNTSRGENAEKARSSDTGGVGACAMRSQ